MIKRIIKAILFWIGITIIPYYIGGILFPPLSTTELFYSILLNWLLGIITIGGVVIILLLIFVAIESTYHYIKDGRSI